MGIPTALIIFATAIIGAQARSLVHERFIRALPPAWLSVDGHQKCLKEFQASPSHSERCLPLSRPDDCKTKTWQELKDALAEQATRGHPTILGGPTVVQPAYLSVTGHENCLEEQQFGATHTVKCLPLSKPVFCNQDVWETLNGVFDGITCAPPVVGGDTSVTPAYVSVPGFKDCLGTFDASDSHSSLCMPQFKRKRCRQDSWDQLKDVFVGIGCPPVLGGDSSLPPAYTSVSGYQYCLQSVQASATHTEWCIPKEKPSQCNPVSWQKLQTSFVGDTCLPDFVVAGDLGSLPPSYLSLDGFKNCLDDFQASDSHTEYCLPAERPGGCSKSTWKVLRDTFDGIGCPLIGGGASAGPPAYLSVEGFKNCLLTYEASPTHEEYCLPRYKSSQCSEVAWMDLQTKFHGIRCPPLKVHFAEGVSSLEPSAWVSVTGHRSCLEVFSNAPDHHEWCLPRSIPDGCSPIVWLKLGITWDGVTCAKPTGHNAVQVGPPAYLSVLGFRDCLGEYQASQLHTALCMPHEKSDSCRQDSWDMLQEVFNGIVCPKKENTATKLTPTAQFIAEDTECLEVHRTTDTFAEQCLPQERPDTCNKRKWKLVKKVFKGIRCAPKQVNVGLGAPPYLSIEGFEKCLRNHQSPTATYSELCLPYNKPDDCDSGVFNQLLSPTTFTGIRCPETLGGETSTTPEYANVEGYKDCLEVFEASETHVEWCMPSDQPVYCPTDTWEKLQVVFDGIGCPNYGGYGQRLSAPEYLSVEGHEDCLDNYQASPTHSEKCLPTEKLPECKDPAWKKLQEVFIGVKCPLTSTRYLGAFAIPPAYLLVPGFESCLGVDKLSYAHHVRCMPLQKPQFCHDFTWGLVKATFVGGFCAEEMMGAIGANTGQPAYLTVPGFKDCLGNVQASDSHKELCLPQSKPNKCQPSSWDTLQDVFEGIICPEAIGANTGQPAYLSVPGFKDCLGNVQASESHNELCLPQSKPTNCKPSSWDTLQDVFEGVICDEESGYSQAIGANTGQPAYLTVPGFKDCLGNVQASESHSELCLPQSRPTNCQPSSWDTLQDVFEGVICDEESGYSQAIGANTGQPAYLTVPKFKDCLGNVQASGSHSQLCLPQSKPNKCQPSSWDTLQDVFEGVICPEAIGANTGQPAYLTVPGFRKCLGEYQEAGASHSVLCLPEEKPTACKVDSWEQLKDVFEGIQCPQPKIIGGISGLPPGFVNIEGYQDCLEGFQASETHTENCLPLSRPLRCKQQAYDSLMDYAFGTYQGGSQPPILGGPDSLPPQYVFVPKFKDCLGNQPDSGTHTVYCMPQSKPDKCPIDSWHAIQNVFEGDDCKPKRGGILFFPSIEDSRSTVVKPVLSAIHYKTFNYCNVEADCPNGLNQCSPVFGLSDWKGICVPLHCIADGHCPNIGDVCTIGSISGRCNTVFNQCEYNEAIAIAGCIPEPLPVEINYSTLTYCDTPNDCPPGLKQCSSISGVGQGICTPVVCDSDGTCPDIGDICTTGSASGSCYADTCTYEQGLIIAVCTGDEEERRDRERPIAAGYSTFIYCDDDIDCPDQLGQCTPVLQTTDDSGQRRKGICVPQGCLSDNDCPSIGDVCNSGSISGECNTYTGICEYDGAIAIAGCIPERDIDYSTLTYCDTPNDCPPGLKQCSSISGGGQGICTPFGCDSDGTCPDIGDICTTGAASGSCYADTCTYEQGLIIAVCTGDEEERRDRERPIAADYSTFIYCDDDIDCPDQLGQCTPVLQTTDDSGQRRKGICVPQGCLSDNECPSIGDVCNSGSISGECNTYTGICEYDGAIAIAGCIPEREQEIDYSTFTYCDRDTHCPENHQCSPLLGVTDSDGNRRRGICAPNRCNGDRDCPSIGDVCDTGSVSGFCDTGKCKYDEAIAIAGCQPPPEVDFNTLMYCNNDEECPEGLDQCMPINEGQDGVCAPLRCNSNDECPDVGDICVDGQLSGGRCVSFKCRYEDAIVIASCSQGY